MLMRRERAYAAIAVMLDVGWHAGRQRLESAGDIADRLVMARRGIEPVLQNLSRAGLLDSTRGPKGGHRLGRSARQITLAEVIDAISGHEDIDEARTEASGELQVAAVEPLWLEVEHHIRSCLESVTLEQLIARTEATGLRRPDGGPILFAI